VRVLIVKPSSLGDILHTFPAVYALQQAFPQLDLSWVVNRSLAEIVEMLPGIDRVIAFPREELGVFKGCSALRSFRRELLAQPYDLALDFQGLLRSALICKFSKAPIRVGFDTAREGAAFFYHHRIKLPAEIRHAVEKNLFLARSYFRLEATGLSQPQLRVKPAWLDEAQSLLQAGPEPVVAVAYSSRWPSKNWPPGFFAEVLRELLALRPQCKCWLLGSKSEREAGEELRERVAMPQLVNLAGQSSLGGLVGLLKKSAVLLTNDSGPMHIAAALQVPCVALFGATDLGLTGPYGEQHRVFRSKCPQSPCFLRDCPRHAGACAEGVSVSAVVKALADKM